VSAEALAEQESLAEYELLGREAHKIYAAEFLKASGLRCLPENQTWGLRVPLPNDWLLELTDGGDGPLKPPWRDEGNEVIFWLITPEGLYAEEDARTVTGAGPDLIPVMVVAYANRLLWRHREDFLGEIPLAKRKNLPRAQAEKIKVLVERGVFVQPAMGQDDDGASAS
jgi:hypothetical protein